MNLFFFGTLMDPEVREIVCGKPLDSVEPAIAQGFRRVFVAGRHYPMLLAHSSGWVEGTLVTGLDATTVHRLQVYEGWEYTLQPIKVRAQSGQSVMAHVFLCPPGIKPDKREWRFQEWELRHKRAFLPRARQLMEVALKCGRMPGARSGQRPRPALAPKPVRKAG